MKSRPRVLIPSDNFDFVANFVRGYNEAGFDAVGGHINFELEAGDFDVVHLLWPEEFTGWNLPTAAQVDSVLRRLDRWAKRSHLIISVNNLYPHRDPKDPLFHRLYTGFYKSAEVIHHFSQASKNLVCREYPSIAGRNHIVRVGFNYERLLPVGPRDRNVARRSFGIAPDEMVFLVFGALRFWKEVQLLRRAFDLTRVAKKRLLLTAWYNEDGPLWRRRWRRWRWRWWEQSKGVLRVAGRVPDEDLPRLFDAIDAVVVVRHNVLYSGVPSLAMT